MKMTKQRKKAVKKIRSKIAKKDKVFEQYKKILMEDENGEFIRWRIMPLSAFRSDMLGYAIFPVPDVIVDKLIKYYEKPRKTK